MSSVFVRLVPKMSSEDVKKKLLMVYFKVFSLNSVTGNEITWQSEPTKFRIHTFLLLNIVRSICHFQ